MLLVFATHGAQVVSEGLDEDLGGLVVVTGQSLLELLNVHGEGLLEELDVLRLTNSDQHRLEDLQSVLSDGLAVVIGHVLGHNGQERLNKGSERLSKILADLAEHVESTSLPKESVGVHADSLLTKAFDLDLH